MLRRWMQASRQAAGSGLQAFPGHGRPRDAELARLRKENKALRDANEILKKAAVIFAQEEPR
jgi:transposase-like protein